MLSWDVIFWDDCVDYVPSSWGNPEKTKYVWPAHIRSQARIRQIINACESPTVEGKWTEHAAQMKKQTNSIAEAEEYCTRFCYESILSNASADESNARNTTKKSSESTVPASQFVTESQNPDEDNHQSTSPASRSPTPGSESGQGDTNKQTSTSRWTTRFNDQNRQRKTTSHSSTSQTPDSRQTFNNRNHRKDTYWKQPTNTATRALSPSSISSSLSSHYNADIGNHMLKMLENIAELQQNQKIIKHDVLSIKGLLEKLVAGEERFTNLVESKFELPLKDDGTLDTTEAQLLQDPSNINRLAHELSLVGGENQHKAVLQIMKKLITRDLSMLYSSKGRKGKRNFSTLKICEAVIRAVRMRFPTATDTDIFKDIGVVLATAGDRDGGRRQRIRENPGNP